MITCGPLENIPEDGGRLRMLCARMIMALNCRDALTCVVILIYLSEAVNGSFISDTLDLDLSLFVRHRRSYGEQHRKSKEAMPGIGNAVKSTSHSGKQTVFITENCTVVVAQTGGTATLPCVVRKFSNGVVSWIRKHDYHLLTVGVTTYNTDERFLVEHVRHLQNWGLLIKHVQPTDAGLYECQVSTHPPTSILVELKVTKAQAEIQGSPELYIRAGSLLKLICTLRHSTEPPAFVFWYHEQRMINYDPGVSVKEGRSSSILHLQDAEKSHNGNYTCSPSNAVPASINVHVLNATAEEKPAAMQHATSTRSSSSSFLLHCSLLIAIMTSALTTTSS
ncbi:neuronal growth regulator 1-like [Euwallacea similis]|uniref:neuronal growth regulator 1-like n=1 Tax=Euwallacea similis TaxID=1736056 RepID=UPI003450E491